MLANLLAYLVLPGEVTSFERDYLARMNRVALLFFAAHVPVFTLVAWVNGTSSARAFALTLAMIAGPMIATRTLPNPRHVSMTFGFTAMGLGGLLVHFGQGPMQIEMHFYFFVLIALLAVFANPAVILTAACTVTLHHLVLWLLVPASVFNYDASFWTVMVHALFVVLESVAACFVARSFFDNVIGLERAVQARTAEVDTRNRELRRILDTVGQGLVTIDLEGAMSVERSAVLARWLGDAVPGERFVDYLSRTDGNVGAAFGVGWEAVLDDVLPLELCLAQMPRHLDAAGLQLQIAYTPIFAPTGEGAALARVLIVLTDVTAERERERAEADQRDLIQAMDHIQRDRASFLEFLTEGEVMLRGLRAEVADLSVVRRLLHTLKGNASLFGLSRVAAACHALEGQMAETREAPAPRDLEALGALWAGVRARLAAVLGEDMRRRIEIDDQEYAAVLHGILEGAPPVELAELVRGWKCERLGRRLARISEQGRAVAERLGKGSLDIEIHDAGLRLDPDGWVPFWSALVHTVRNAVDHGIESKEERVAAGKPAQGRLVLTSAVDAYALVVSITDDGRGIDWNAVERRARALGVPVRTDDERHRALLLDGLTTRDEVGTFSGRGVGLGAVAAACHERGGEMAIRSERGAGTTVSFRFPGVFRARLLAA
ncbi:MAG: ATP-binding protein [Myxococcota bacterium]